MFAALPPARCSGGGWHPAVVGVGSCCCCVLIAARHIAFRPFAERVAREQHLPDDLARGQVAHEPHRAGVAETAVQGAADLARHAERAAVGVGDEHHLIRSEEHTSELQSLMRISYAVFCLKKKKTNNKKQTA